MTRSSFSLLDKAPFPVINRKPGKAYGKFLLVCFLSLLLVACFSFFSHSAAPGIRTVRVGAFNYYPGIFKDRDGRVKGFYVDALEDLGRRENIRFEYVYGSWSEALSRLKSGEVDLLTSVAYTPERATYMDYARRPLLTVWGELYVSPSSEIDGLREVRGKKIAVVRDDVNAQHFMALVRKFDIPCRFVQMSGFDEVFAATAAGRVDAGVVNSTFGVPKQKEYGLRSTGIIFNPFDIYFATAKGKNSELLRILDRYQHEWRHSNSVYNAARQRWAHGVAGTIYVVPGWVTKVGAALCFLAVGAACFILLLRRQVALATRAVLLREASLRESETKFRSYIDSSPEGIFVLDDTGGFVEVNCATTAILGASQEELLSCSMTGFFPPEDNEKVLLCLAKLKETGNASCEVELITRGGIKIWCSIDGVRLPGNLYLCFMKDISERKTAEGKLRLQSMVLEQIHDRVTVTDLEGIIEYVNQAEVSGLGLPREEIIGKHVRILGDDRSVGATQREILEQTLAAGKWRGEVVNFDSNGVPFIIDCRTTVVRDDAGNPVSLCGIGTDITQRKKADEALKCSLAEKEVLLREVHHRVKNNLAAIIGLLELQSCVVEDPTGKMLLSEFCGRVRSMSLVHEKLYRSESVSKIDCQDYITDLMVQLRSSLYRPEVVLDVDAQGVELPLDVAVPCGLIINELVTNALKYAFPRRKPLAGADVCRVGVSLTRGEGNFTLSVCDNGVGFPPDLDWSSGKTLGLFLVKMLGQHQMGGALDISSGKGCRVTLTFAVRKA
jgi:PAS domain S-box-containing protein